MKDETILETFLGHVDEVNDDSAFVTLKSPSGEILKGCYSAAEFAKLGIEEGARFECSTVKIGPNEVRITFKPLPSLALGRTEQTLRRLRELAIDDLSDD